MAKIAYKTVISEHLNSVVQKPLKKFRHSNGNNYILQRRKSSLSYGCFELLRLFMASRQISQT